MPEFLQDLPTSWVVGLSGLAGLVGQKLVELIFDYAKNLPANVAKKEISKAQEEQTEKERLISLLKDSQAACAERNEDYEKLQEVFRVAELQCERDKHELQRKIDNLIWKLSYNNPKNDNSGKE